SVQAIDPAQEEPAPALRQLRVEHQGEPAGQPLQVLWRHGAGVEEEMRVLDAFLDGGVKAFEVGEEPFEETVGAVLLGKHRRQVMIPVREAGIPGPDGSQGGGGSAASCQRELDLEVATLD